MNIENITGYCFYELSEPDRLATSLRERCKELGLKGTVLIAKEGINFSVSGEAKQAAAFYGFLLDWGFPEFPVKQSYSVSQSHRRMLVKVKEEIVTMRYSGVNPKQEPAPYISPEELRDWLRSGKDFVLLDTRKDFEYQIGTFKGARRIGVNHFSDFPSKAKELLPELGNKPVVTFCTGGIRCEKGAPAMLREGFHEVYQLEGGLLNYFEKCGGEFFEGDCFVFDRRVAIHPDLKPVQKLSCTSCGEEIEMLHQGEEANHHLCSSCLPSRGSSSPSFHSRMDAEGSQ